MSDDRTPSDPPAPLLRIVSGEPTSEELAALVAVLASRPRVTSAPTATPVSHWAAPHRRMRRELRPGPGGWRASAFPM